MIRTVDGHLMWYSRRFFSQRDASIFVLAVFLILAQPSLAADDTDAVQGTFSAYRSAILSGDGEAAAALLSQNTLGYYNEARRIALYGELDEVEEQALVTQMIILSFRLRVPTERLESFSTRSLVAHVIEKGWIGKNSVEKLGPGQIFSEGDAAMMRATVEGHDTTIELRFSRESGAWRLDLLPTMVASNTALQNTAKQQGVSERELLVALLERVTGRKVDSRAWNSMKEPVAANVGP